MNLDHSLKSQVILSLWEQIKDTLSCHLTSTFLKYFTTFLNKINARNVWSAVMTSWAYYASNRSSSLNAFWFDLWPAYATFLLAFSQFIKLFLPSFMFTTSSSQVLQISDSQSFSGRQLCLPGDADWMEQSLRPQHLTLEGTLSLDLSREQPKKWFSPPSLHSCHAAGQIKTSKLQNPHRCLICSLEGKKKIKLLISIKQVGTSTGWQLSSLGQGQRK